MKLLPSLRLLAMLLLLALPAIGQAQYTYTTNSGAITITQYTGTGGAVTIPGTINGLPVVSIGNNAFYYCTNLTSVTIPTSVTNIGINTFRSCSGLTSVTIPNSVISIGDSAFYSCSSLTRATIGTNVTNIGIYAFAFSGLTSVMVPDSVTNVGIYAFAFCSSLTSVTVLNHVISIGDYAFYYCTGLTGVYFQGNATNVNVGLGVFSYDNIATIHYVPGTTGWGPTFAGRPTALWKPRMETGDGDFGVRTNQFGFNLTWASDRIIVVEACVNPGSTPWTTLQTCTVTNGSIYFSDPAWTNYRSRIYRISSP